MSLLSAPGAESLRLRFADEGGFTAPLDLNGKVALVTGAGRGIGLSVAEALAARGASVALVDLDLDAAEAAATPLGERALGLAADVADPEAIEAAVAATVERFGALDVCVANAGIAPAAGTVRATAPEAFERVIEVNLLGVYRTVRAALPQVIERSGHISVVSSIYAFFNGVLAAPYGVSKAGVESLGRAVRTELAAAGASAGVAYFGFVATEMVKERIEADPLGVRMERDHIPSLLRRRLSPRQAAEILVQGIEHRSPRVYGPRWLRGYAALRGVLNPLLDRRFERDAAFLDLVRDGDVEGRTADREIAAARPQDRPPDPETR